MTREVFYFEISRRKLGLGKLSFVLSVVCELFGKFYSWARRTKVRNYGAFALSKPLDGSTRVCWRVAPRFHRRISCLLPGLPAQFWRKEHGRRCLHLALFGDIILIVLLRILNCCVDPVPVRNDYFGGGVCMSVYYDLFHMTGCVSLF